MKPELQQHLDNLAVIVPGIDKDEHPAHSKYLDLKRSLEILSSIPKKDWNKPETIEAINE